MILDKNQIITHPFVFLDNWLTEEELKKINDYCISQGVEESKVIYNNGEQQTDSSIRQSSTKFHSMNDENRYIFEKIRDASSYINLQSYQFDLIGFDFFQYGEYKAESNDFYNYHIDMTLGEGIPHGMTYPRKLSLSIILNDPSEYEGGELEFNWGMKEKIIVEQPKGRLIAFPSWLMHRVTPVTKGIRRSIVVWIVGSKFK